MAPRRLKSKSTNNSKANAISLNKHFWIAWVLPSRIPIKQPQTNNIQLSKDSTSILSVVTWSSDGQMKTHHINILKNLSSKYLKVRSSWLLINGHLCLVVWDSRTYRSTNKDMKWESHQMTRKYSWSKSTLIWATCKCSSQWRWSMRRLNQPSADKSHTVSVVVLLWYLWVVYTDTMIFEKLAYLD